MTQTILDLPAAPDSPAPTDRTGFQIGWDHAHHGLVPPPELMLAGTPVAQGWMAAKAVFGRRTLSAARPVRQWLELRLSAWRAGEGFEATELTPNYIGQLHSERCPVLRQRLGGARHEPQAATFLRLNPAAGWAAGHVVVVSHAAAAHAAGQTVEMLVRRARQAEAAASRPARQIAERAEAAEAADPAQGSGHEAGTWWRLAALRAFATPLSFHDAARLPLAVLPPNRVRLLNAAQGLQALVTTQFLAPGWGARLKTFADLLPEHTLRQDFNLFVSALVPRVLEAQAKSLDLRHTLEDAWLVERVQRRWQHLAFSLGEAGVASLLERALGANLATQRTLVHEVERATAGWGLDRAAVAPGPWPALADGARPATGQPVRRLGGRTAGRPPKNRSATTGARPS
jgi:hypothetical protein